jgi:hypothetical protein
MSNRPVFYFWTMHWVGGRCYVDRHASDSPTEARRAHEAAMGWYWVPRDANTAQVSALFAETSTGVRPIAGDRRREEPGSATAVSMTDLAVDPFERP